MFQIIQFLKKDFKLLEIVSNASKEMSEGELVQIQKSRSLNIDTDTYYEVIRKKTASLIAACTASGASSSGADQEVVDRIYEMGIKIGMAFQIKDDLFDFQPHGLIGKPTGNDIKEKKFTLPLIYALNQAEPGKRKMMIRKIKNGNRSQRVVNEVVLFVKEMGGIDFAFEKMQEFKSGAMEILQTFPDSPSRNSLRELVEFTVSRNK